MHTFVMYCKTYGGDLDRLSNLVSSYKKYNRENIPLYISSPESELYLFQSHSDSNVIVMSDESFAEKYLAIVPHSGMSLGYVNQQICKLTFYKTAVARNYLCLDSDAVFIRDFYVSDFMHDELTPYIVLVMDKDLSIERHYRTAFWLERQASIQKIYDYMGLDDRRLRTCHGHQIFNMEVLESLLRDFMKPRNLSYNDLLKIAPYEFTWYNVWFQKNKLVKEVAVEPFFKTLHMRQEYIFSKIKTLRIEDYAETFVGLVLNSKWTPRTPLNYENPDGLFYKILYNCLFGAPSRIFFKLARKDILSRIFKKLCRSCGVPEKTYK